MVGVAVKAGRGVCVCAGVSADQVEVEGRCGGRGRGREQVMRRTERISRQKGKGRCACRQNGTIREHSHPPIWRDQRQGSPAGE